MKLVMRGQHEDHGEEDYGSADNECYEEDQNLLGQMHSATPSLPARNILATARNKDVPHSHSIDIFSACHFIVVSYTDSILINHLHQVGKDVILYAMLRSDQLVAKGMIISINPSTVLGGQA
uniref:Transposase Tnp1/En/Spm-like domain-containing protein n=1 Tax=Arundo donax TaxID=35708 RepID=A0A0A9D2A1_ARUDO